MVDNKRMCSWWMRSSSAPFLSSLKVLWIVVPLIVVSGFLALLGSETSNWAFSTSDYYQWLWSSVPPSSSSSSLASSITFMTPNTTRDSVSAVEENGDRLHSHSRPVVGNHGDEALVENSTLNTSADAPSVDHMSIRADEKEENLNAIANGTPVVSSANESQSLPLQLGLGNKYSKLEKLEARLGQARAAIREARNNRNKTQDPDYVPTGPIYWNANAFHRSYLEMEKRLKIFVYEEGEPPIFHDGPCKSIYAMEGNFIYRTEVSKFRTRDPDEAHVFFLPISVTSIVHFVYVPDSHDWAPMKELVRDYVNLIAGKYHYWNRSLGADHFMLSCHDWGPELSNSVPHLFKNSIRALCNANISEGFNPAKDVSFPEILLRDGTTYRLLGGPSPSKRPILVFFAGGVHGPIRPILLEHWENKDEDVQVHKYLPKGVSYNDMLRKSRYCICASGYEVASPRMVEALYMGCVPVLIKDHYVAPFSDVLNWKSFSVEIPVRDIPKLKEILMGISQRQYIRLQRRGRQVRRHFEVNLPPKRYDVYHMILHSIWLRRLNIRVRGWEES